MDYIIIFNATSNSMAITEFDSGIFTDVNEAWIRTTGIPKEMSVGKTALELGIWDNYSNRDLCIQELANNGYLSDFESTLIMKSKKKQHLISAQITEMNGIRYILWEFRDISEQKRITEELIKGQTQVNQLLDESEQSRRALLGILEDEKLAKDALRQSEKQFRSVLENIALLGVILDTEGNITLINEYLLQLTGWQRNEVLNQNWFNMFLPIEIRDNIKIEIFNSVRNGEIIAHFENEIITRKGDQRIIAWNNTILFDHHGTVVGIASIGEDITERKKNEEALKESEYRYRLVTELATDYVYKLGVSDEGKITFDFVSDSFYSITGSQKEGAKTIDIWDKIIHPDDIGKIMQLLQSLVKNHQSSEIECRSFVHGQQMRWISVIARSEWDEKENRVVAIYGAVKDITERKIAEEALLQSEDKFSKAFKTSPEAISIASLENGKHIDVNDLFLKITGYERNEVIGHSSSDLNIWVDPEDRKKYDSGLIQNKGLRSFETQFRMKSGEIRDFLMSGEIIELGNIQCSLNFILDITEKKKVEKVLEEYKNELERLVKERTEELAATIEELHATNEELYSQKEELEAAISSLQQAQNQLIQSEKMASLGVLAAGIAHEINNPLNFIHGGILGIDKYFKSDVQNVPENIPKFINAINEGVKRATEIVKSLNHYSRYNDHSKDDCNMHSIIDNCLIMLQNPLKSKITIKKNYVAGPYFVKGNEGKLHQAILNLISNAEQSIEHEGTIQIKTEISGEFLAIKISDTGCGISPENLQKVFDPFFTTKETGKGTGLGLSITFNIIQEHYGSIYFESQKDKGTTVTIKLPITK